MKRILTLVFALMALSPAFSSGKDDVPVDGKSGKITLYTSESLTDVQSYVDQFEILNPGSEVEIFRLGTTELVARLMTEMQAGKTSADVIWFADMALFEQFAKEGKLLNISPDESVNIPDDFVYFDGMAYELRLIYQVLAYNTNLVKDDVDSWYDLTDSQYKGRVGSASPFVSGATVTQVASVINDKQLGWNFYEELAKNDPVISGGNGGIARGIASGEYAIGLTIDFMARAQQEQESPVGYAYQKEGAIYVPTPAAVMASSDNPELASSFINYLMSVPGQLQMQSNGYMPVNKNIALPEGIPTAAEIPVLKTDWTYLSENREEILNTYADIFEIN